GQDPGAHRGHARERQTAEKLTRSHRMKEAVIVAGARTAVGRAPNGSLRGSRPDDMAAAVIREAIRRADGLDDSEIEDVIIGCAVPEGTRPRFTNGSANWAS